MAGWEEAIELTRWTRAADGWTCDPGPRRSARRAACRHLQRAHHRPARLRRQERLSGNRARPFRRRRLGAERRCRRRCARARARARRAAALAVHRPGEHGGSAVRRRPSRHSPADAADRAGHEKRRGNAGAGLRRPAARRRRRKPPGANPRTSADGHLEQVRIDAADDRQQVGDVCRLRHVVRRHVRRVFRAQGHLQDRGLSPVALAQREPARARERARSAR